MTVRALFSMGVNVLGGIYIYLEPRLHGGSNPDSTRIRFACEWCQPGFQSG